MPVADQLADEGVDVVPQTAKVLGVERRWKRAELDRWYPRLLSQQLQNVDIRVLGDPADSPRRDSVP